MGELEYRTTTAVEVRHAERIIDLIAAPYGEAAQVFLRRVGKWVGERFAPTAFVGVAGDVFVNRAHDTERPIGRVVKFHPNDPRGLRTELRISKTSEGNDVLELADDGLLSASVGFTVPDGGEQWNADRTERTIVRARLAHIALTGDPAYTGAKVLAVRSAVGAVEPVDVSPPVATPILDRIRLERMLASSGATGLQ